MLAKTFLLAVLIIITYSVKAQQLKVKRKGITPLNVSKNVQPAPSKYSLSQFAGKWQEVGRTDENHAGVAFNDTLFYTFLGENVTSRNGVNMGLQGEAAIDPGNVLVAAADVFTINSLANNQAVLDDGTYIHTLVRKKNFWYETFPTNVVVPEKFTTPVIVSISELSGKWKVYRRDALPGKENNRTLIRILNITDVKDNTAKGEITFYQTEKLETAPCTITLNAEKIQISTEKNTWNMSVYKADRKDLVLGDTALMYYCKPL